MTEVVVIVLFIIIVILSIVFNNFFIRWGGAIGIISFCVMILTHLVNYYYSRNRTFYLKVQRFLLWFKKTDSIWFFNIHFENIAKNNNLYFWQIPNFSENIAEALFRATDRKIYIKEQLLNQLVFCVNETIYIKIRYGDGDCISISSNKLLVPSHRYKEYLDIFEQIFSTLEKESRAERVSFRMHIKFPEYNPYMGLFIKHIPNENLSEFHCIFTPTHISGTKVFADKQNLIFDAESLNKLKRLTWDYLSLSTNLIAGEKK